LLSEPAAQRRAEKIGDAIDDAKDAAPPGSRGWLENALLEKGREGLTGNHFYNTREHFIARRVTVMPLRSRLKVEGGIPRSGRPCGERVIGHNGRNIIVGNADGLQSRSKGEKIPQT
jgi:ribosomal protein S6E (S10)